MRTGREASGMLSVKLLALLLCVLLTGCGTVTGIRVARVAHAGGTVLDYTSTVRMQQMGYREGNGAVTAAWPAVLATLVLWGLAEWQEDAGNLKTAVWLHWMGATVHAGAGTYNLTRPTK